jgi:hypothetical protein
MIEEVGVTKDPKAIGYYSGFIEGVFAMAQFCTGELCLLFAIYDITF